MLILSRVIASFLICSYASGIFIARIVNIIRLDQFNANNNRLNTDVKNASKQQFLSWFIGKFDNKKQADEDCISSDPDKHAYVTAEFIVHPQINDIIVAKYYLGKNTSSVFRFRYYDLSDQHTPRSSPSSLLTTITDQLPFFMSKSIRMKILRPSLATLRTLKLKNYDILTYLPSRNDMEHLPGCDVIWKFRVLQSEFLGVLENGKCEICSQYDPTVKLIVTDKLRLAANRLWIDDRVKNSKGELIIGNKRGIPYICDKLA